MWSLWRLCTVLYTVTWRGTFNFRFIPYLYIHYSCALHYIFCILHIYPYSFVLFLRRVVHRTCTSLSVHWFPLRRLHSKVQYMYTIQSTVLCSCDYFVCALASYSFVSFQFIRACSFAYSVYSLSPIVFSIVYPVWGLYLLLSKVVPTHLSILLKALYNWLLHKDRFFALP